MTVVALAALAAALVVGHVACVREAERARARDAETRRIRRSLEKLP